MLKKCNNQKGYTLLLTVFIITIFSIFAIVLITIVLSGAKKNAIREDLTQANELTEKGIQHIKNEIHKELNDIIGHGISRSVYLTEIEDLLTLYHCQNTSPENRRITVSSSTGDYIVCVKEWRGANGNKDDLRKEVTFLSKGFVDGKEVEYETTIELGAEDVPDALNYAVGAHRMCINEIDCIPGEGNLFMHGGVSIYGDIKVDGDLITYDKGYIYYSDVEEGETWLDSVKPDVRPAPNSNVSRFILGGNVYMMTDEPVSYDQHIKSEDFDRVGYEATKLEDALISVPELFLSDRQPERMEITEHKETFQYDLNEHGVTKVLANLPLKERNYSGAKVFLHRFNYITSGQFTLEGNNRFGQLATNGYLTIRNMEENFKSTIIEEGMYVDKDLTIGDRFNESNDINDYEKIKLSGPIYVNGNLTIRGVDLEANALIYVNGEVKILNSRIRGLNENGKEGSLIVLAKQPIEIANISSYQNEASKIRGFFYTEDEFEIFGVGSKIRIEGGVSAKKVVLNAIRGRAQRGVGFTGAQKILSGYEGTGYIKSPIYDYFESVIGQKRNNTESRLQIIYNPDIITTYSDLKEQEPTIT